MRDPVSVLLVEDNPDDVLLIQAALQDASGAAFLVDRVDRLSGALEWLRRRSPAAVLLDLNLPDCKGLETLVILRTHAPLTPIIVFTARPEEEGTRAIQAGAQDYLRKDSYEPELLARSIRYAIERQALVNRLQHRHVREIQEQDRESLGPLAVVGDLRSRPDVFGEHSLRHTSRDLFRVLVRKYADALDAAAGVDDEVLPVRITERIDEIARRLGVLNAGPRDAIELHAVAVDLKEHVLDRHQFEHLRDRGRLVLLELMSGLAAHYRRYTLDFREIHA